MDLTTLAKQAQKFTIDNSPLLLTVAGTAGVVTTAVLSVKAGMKAAHILEDHEAALRARREAFDDPHLTLKEQVNLTWKVYIPPVAFGVTTIGAIIMANQIGTRRAAAVAAAYSLSERAFTEYREKVAETIGEKKAQKVVDEIQQDRMDKLPDSKEIVIIGNGDQLCYDGYSGRLFMSTVEDIKHAVNRVNHEINNAGYASLTDFYNYVGLERTDHSDDVGWNGNKLFEVTFSGVVAKDGRPAIALEYRTEPIRDYFRMY